jgi:hypothetical protein
MLIHMNIYICVTYVSIKFFDIHPKEQLQEALWNTFVGTQTQHKTLDVRIKEISMCVYVMLLSESNGYSSHVLFYVHCSFPPCLYINTFNNFPVISDLLPDVSKCQHNTKLCSKCSSLLVYSLNLNLICW